MCLALLKIQVNLCQKHSFLHQLTHNMTTDCSLNYKFSTRKLQVQYMLCTSNWFLFWHSEQFDVQRFVCTSLRDLWRVHSIFRFSFFCQSDQKWKKSAVIFRQNADFFIQKISKQDSWFFIFGHFDQKTKNGMNSTLFTMTLVTIKAYSSCQ